MREVIKSKILELRTKILVHACVFEIYDDQVVGRETWKVWVDELLDLQKENPSCVEVDYYDNIFKAWDGISQTLPLHDETVRSRASFLVDNKEFTPNFL